MSDYVVVIVAYDGTTSVAGPFDDEYTATLWANAHETEESAWVCNVYPLEAPEAIT
jgi:hypothetical protein